MTSWINRLLQNLWDRIKPVVTPVPATPSPVTIELQEDEKYRGLVDQMEKIPEVSLDNDIGEHKRNFLDYMSKIGGLFRRWGEEDGRIEQKNYAIYDTIRTRVLQLRAYLSSIFLGELLKAQVELSTKVGILESATAEHKAQMDYAAELNDRYYRNYKDFSLTLGIIYLIAALLLIIADIPLAIKLTREGFLLTETWEWLAMSIGVALCTLYVKIYYDEFISPAPKHTVTQFKKLIGINHDEAQEIREIRQAARRKFQIKTAILLLSFTTIIILGFFRFSVFTALNKARVSADVLELLTGNVTLAAFILITLLFPLIGGVCASLGFDKVQNYNENKRIGEKCRLKEQAKSDAAKEVVRLKKKEKICEGYLKWCGASYEIDSSPGTESASPIDAEANSVSLSEIDERGSVKDPASEKEKLFKESNGKGSSTNGIDEVINEEESDFVKDYTLDFLSKYFHGYEHGLTLNSLRKDIFTKAEDFRRRSISAQMSSRIDKDTPESIYDKLKQTAEKV